MGALIAYAVVVYACSEDDESLEAFTVAVTIFVFVTILLPLVGYFGTLQKLNFTQVLFHHFIIFYCLDNIIASGNLWKLWLRNSSRPCKSKFYFFCNKN